MPVAAAGLADVGSGDLHPGELGGPGKHLVEQLAIAGLAVRPLSQGPACVRNTDRKSIAQRLQLTKAKRPRRAAGGGNPRVNLEAGEGLRDERGQLPLKTTDLSPQLGPSQALIVLDSKRETGVSI
jgi:hypothetical protein